MITIKYDFKNRNAKDVEQLNAILSTMVLEDLRLEDSTGYLATTTDEKDNLLHQRYGVDRGTLICTLAKDDTGYHYQIDTAAVDQSVTHETFLEIWRNSHPDRVHRIVYRVKFDDMAGYLIIHHQKT